MQIMNKKLSENVYCFLFSLWSAFTTIATYTTFSSLEVLHLDLVYKVVRITIIVFLFFRTLRYVKKYTLKQFCMICLLISIVIITFFHNRYDYFYPIAFFIIASYQIDLRRALSKVLNIQIIVAIVTITCAVIGIIPNYMFFRGSIPRPAMGYSHPNTLGSFFLAIVLLSFYLYRKKNPKRFYGTLLICFVMTNNIACSRTSASLILLVLAAQITSVIAEKKECILAFSHWVLGHADLWVWLIALINVLTVWKKINIGIGDATFRARFAYASNYLNRYGITLFGRDLYFGDNDQRILPDWTMKKAMATLDNSYIFLLIGFGLVGALFFLFSYTIRIRRAKREGNYTLIAVFLLYAIDGVMETAMIRCYFNCFMLLFADLIWKKNQTYRYKFKFRRRSKAGT